MSVEAGHASYCVGVRVREWETRGSVVRIGRYSSVAHNVEFVVDGNHNTGAVSSFPFRGVKGWSCDDPSFAGSKGVPSVGNDVWIGADVVIHSGVHVGDGAVVAGQSVVTKPVPPYAVVAGNPATVKKYRFPPHVIAAMLEVQWWDLEETQLRPLMEAHYTDPAAFVAAVRAVRAEAARRAAPR
jgi:acetyltransferase-like isoleucine patch superfamily enzyme